MRGQDRVNGYFRKKIARRYQENYHGPAPTLFCNNCTGSMMLHDLGLRFNSPFVNLWIRPDDFLAICANPEAELAHELVQVESEFDYPVATLNGKRIYLQHYDSFAQAKEIWNRRLERVDFSNINVLFVLRDSYRPETIQAFKNIPQQRKLMLVAQGQEAGEDTLALPNATNSQGGGLQILTDYVGWFGRRYYDEFDFPAWISDGTIRLAR